MRRARALSRRAGEALARRGYTLAVAESCTGGLLGGAVTSVPGSSGWFLGGVVSYSDASKVRDLGVPARTIAERGAVSREVALAMAAGVLRRFGADASVGITGIAGPSGGGPGKPVGTVWIAVVVPGVRNANRYRFPGDREAVRAASVEAALERLLAALGPSREGRG